MTWNTVSEFREQGGQLVPYVDVGGTLRPVAWAPLPGIQAAFLASTEKIVLFQGGRGPPARANAYGRCLPRCRAGHGCRISRDHDPPNVSRA